MANIEQRALPVSEPVAPGIHAVDTEYVRRRMDASHLIIDGAHAAFVDTGVNASIPNLEAALCAQGLSVSDVEYILLTHIHLDHAGGAGLLAQRCPQAKVLVHPRGAGHLAEPAKLIAATKQVYGEAAYAKIYGDILPIPAARIVAVEEGHRFNLGARRFEVLHTPGHALHHVCFVDRETGHVFAGDTFGVSYREMDNEQGEFVIATTTPTQFDPEQLHASIERIKNLNPRSVFLTHYSRVSHVRRLAEDLHRDIDRYVAIAREHADASERSRRIRESLHEWYAQRLREHAWDGGDEHAYELLNMDLDLNAAGLDAWLKRAA